MWIIAASLCSIAAAAAGTSPWSFVFAAASEVSDAAANPLVSAFKFENAGPPPPPPEASSGGPLEVPQDFSVCSADPSLDPELKRMCLLTVDHLAALYRRLAVQYRILQPLTPEQVLDAVAEKLTDILAEEDRIADLVIAKKLPHGALPVRSLKQAVQAKLEALGLLKPKNITTQEGLMGLQLREGRLCGLEACVEALVSFFTDLIGAKFRLSGLTPAEVSALVTRLQGAFGEGRMREDDLPAVLEAAARAVLDEVAALSRAESLSAALQSMAPLVLVGEDDGLSPLTAAHCLTLVRGLFPTLRAHMTLHYEMQDPSEAQLYAMAAVLLPLVNAHRGRLRVATQRGITLLAPEEHALLWGYMEQYAREHQLVGAERPLNLWRFPAPAGAANLLD